MRKKSGRKIVLHRETLHTLSGLERVAGGANTLPRVCTSMCTFTACQSGCPCTNNGNNSVGPATVCCPLSSPFLGC